MVPPASVSWDAKVGFWSIHLDEKSSYLTTFNTHHGRYQFLFILFGMKMCMAVFQMYMYLVMECLSGIITVHDDICVYGHSPKEHIQHLLRLIKIGSQHGIIFNSSKCQIRQSQIAFYSAVLNTQGILPDPSKIQALQDLPIPDSPVKLQSFLGLIHYLQPFIPGSSNKTMFLWEQLTRWDGNPLTDTAFQYLKAWISQTLLNTTLAYCDGSKPVIVLTDASQYGLGTGLLQSRVVGLSPLSVKPLLLSRPTMQILNESVCQCALALRNFKPISMAGM